MIEEYDIYVAKTSYHWYCTPNRPCSLTVKDSKRCFMGSTDEGPQGYRDIISL